MENLAACPMCFGTKWSPMFERIIDEGNLVHGWVPCRVHGEPDFPDYVETPLYSHPPVRGVDYVRVEGTCAGGNPAINGCCNDLLCACDPPIDIGVTRVRIDDEEAVYVIRGHKDLGHQFLVYLSRTYGPDDTLYIDGGSGTFDYRRVNIFEQRLFRVAPLARPR